MTAESFDELRKSALDHYWFPGEPWNDVSADGGMCIITEGKGVKLKDIHGNWYQDAFAGLMLVNVGHGREEIA